jgi:hypothetical protein
MKSLYWKLKRGIVLAEVDSSKQNLLQALHI